MFYRNFITLCNQAGKSPSAAAVELGLEKSTVTRWKKGGRPTDATVQKVADYFGVTPESLLSDRPARPQEPDALEVKLLEAIRPLTDDQKRLLLAQIKLLEQ